MKHWRCIYDFFVVPSEGGLLCCWRKNEIISIISSCKRFIVARVFDPLIQKYFVFCGAHGSPRKELKMDFFWSLLSLIDNEALLIMGDLKLIIEQHEKMGGNWFTSLQCKIKDLWDNSRVIDL